MLPQLLMTVWNQTLDVRPVPDGVMSCRAISFEPGNITFLRNRGNCRRLQGSFAEAVEDFDR